jgi:group I intron endonuclease
MKCRIYLIRNTVNGKTYVGYTKNEIKKRFYQHSKSSKPIGKAIKLYGEEKFTVEILEEANSVEEALELEKKWIAHYKSNVFGYNCTKGGDISPIVRAKDVYKTKEFADKVRKNAIKQHSDPNKKQAHVNGIRKYWDTLSEEKREIRRRLAIENGKKSKVAWNKGKKLPGTGMTGEKNPMARHYKVWYPDGSETVIFCLSSFCKEQGLTYRNAIGVIEGKQSHHKGFRFARLEIHT